MMDHHRRRAGQLGDPQDPVNQFSWRWSGPHRICSQFVTRLAGLGSLVRLHSRLIGPKSQHQRGPSLKSLVHGLVGHQIEPGLVEMEMLLLKRAAPNAEPHLTRLGCAPGPMSLEHPIQHQAMKAGPLVTALVLEARRRSGPGRVISH